MLNLKKFYTNYLLLICLSITVYLLYIILSLTNSGIDFTDEGFYLNWISSPKDYKASLTQFGFIYNPIFFLLDYDIANLRKTNLVFNFFLSYCVVSILCKKLTNLLEVNFFHYQILLLTLSIPIFLSIDILSPSYNSLVIQGLLVTCFGILIEEFKKNLSYLFVGIGGWMVFMGKPSSAFILAIIITIYFLSKKGSFRSIFLSSAVSIIILLISALLIDHSLSRFIERVYTGLIHTQIFDSVFSKEIMITNITSIARQYESQNLNSILYTALSIIFIFLYFYILFFINLNNSSYNYLFKISIISLLTLLLVLAQLNFLDWIYIFERYQRLQISSIILFSFFLSLKANFFDLKKTIKDLDLRLIFLFLLLPLVYSFGTSTNLIKKSLDASIFILLASFIIIFPSFRKNINFNHLLIFAFIGLIITSIHVNWKIKHPTRQMNSLKLNKNIITYHENKNKLKFNKVQSEYIVNAKNISMNAGLVKGTDILDLSGKSPGLIFLLDANSLGDPWMIGGYKNSIDYSIAKLNLVNCKKISKAWIIHDNFSRNISLDILNSYGSDILLDYKEAGNWKASIYKGYFKQTLYKPINSNSILNKCINKRNLGIYD